MTAALWATTLVGHLVHRPGLDDRTLCGVRVDAMHETWPAGQECAVCFAESGVCPVCGGNVRVKDGVTVRHRERVMSRRGIVSGTRWCGGSGQPPDGGVG